MSTKAGSPTGDVLCNTRNTTVTKPDTTVARKEPVNAVHFADAEGLRERDREPGEGAPCPAR